MAATTMAGGSGVLHSVALTGYRELLAGYGLKLVGGQQAGSSIDEGATWMKDAKDRVKAELTRKVIEKYQRLVAYDPRRALRRLQGRMQEASAAFFARSHSVGLPPSLDSSSHREDLQQLENVKGPDGLLRDLLVPVVSAASRFFMHSLTDFTVNGSEKFAAALDRPPGTPLITVSNHVGALDDPFIIAAILPRELVSDSKAMRWTMCASDRCFKHSLLTPFFRAAKVLETERGLGLHQPAMWAAEERLCAGDWVHIFPEGTRSKNGGKIIGKVRWGVGRLAAACDSPPIILPLVHTGMEKLNPRGSILPRPMQTVTANFGDAVPVEDIWRAWREGKLGDEDCYREISNRVQAALVRLKAEVDGTMDDIQLLGVLPGVLGPLDPSPRWWKRVSSPGQGLFASLAAAQAAAPVHFNWSSRITKQVAMISVGTTTTLLDISAAYSLVRTSEICRILSA